MAKVKYTGAGATVLCDTAGDGTFVTVGCTTSMTPPPQVKPDIETTCQQDAAASAEPGIEQISQAQYIEPFDIAATEANTDAWYASGATKDWQMVFVKGTDTMVIQFPGYVSGLTPAAAGGSDMVQRTVTLTRNGPITYNPTP